MQSPAKDTFTLKGPDVGVGVAGSVSDVVVSVSGASVGVGVVYSVLDSEAVVTGAEVSDGSFAVLEAAGLIPFKAQPAKATAVSIKPAVKTILRNVTQSDFISLMPPLKVKGPRNLQIDQSCLARTLP